MPQCAAGFSSRLKWSQTVNRHRAARARTKAALQRPRNPTAAGLPCKKSKVTRRDAAEDLAIIEQLLTLALEAISKKTPDVRLADVLKLLEFKHRLKPQADARQVFWDWIDRFRREAAQQKQDRDAEQPRPSPKKENATG